MPVQIVRPRSIRVASGGARRAILLTGASGVVGRAVLGRLRDFDVVCLVHRSPVCGPNVTGMDIDVPRFVPPDMFDRLIGPVLLDALPVRICRNVLRMLEFFTTYLQSGETKPSSLDQLVALGVRPLPDQRESLRNSVQYWAAQRGYGQAQTGTEKAA
jgi:hypothetical protein